MHAYYSSNPPALSIPNSTDRHTTIQVVYLRKRKLEDRMNCQRGGVVCFHPTNHWAAQTKFAATFGHPMVQIGGIQIRDLTEITSPSRACDRTRRLFVDICSHVGRRRCAFYENPSWSRQSRHRSDAPDVGPRTRSGKVGHFASQCRKFGAVPQS